MSKNVQAILLSLKKGLTRVLGPRLEAIYLFGSQARGDARQDSDIDVLVVIREPFDYRQLAAMTSELVANLSLENDVVISRVMVSKERYERENSPFFQNVRREGVLV